MKILLFGGAGQLGYELIKRAADLNFEVISPVTSEVDICNLDQVRFITDKVRPEFVINSAAYTAVDKAEEDKDRAFAVNRDGARNVAHGASDIGANLIHISTDYVFDGMKGTSYNELDIPNPINVYGASKLAGEAEVTEVTQGRAMIARTASLHGQRGENFVHTMLKLFEEREVVRVVSDQLMSPTWAGWLAEAVLDLSRMKTSGVIHASCMGVCSWFEFAQGIYRMGKPSKGSDWKARLDTMKVADLGRPARRPPNSSFDTTKVATLLGRNPMSWEEGLRNHLRDIGRLKE